MSRIQLVNVACVEPNVDVVVNAANRYLYAGGGICGVIFYRAGIDELTAECKKIKRPIKVGHAYITSSCRLTKFKAIIHAVGPNFYETPRAFNKLFNAYYNSLKVLMDNGYHSISFPLISSGLFGGNLENPVGESMKQCCLAYKKFTADYPEYYVDVITCAYLDEIIEAQREFKNHFELSI